jgi:homogentisate phytyltransferase / homogentisate geranylgeranyltransferase
MLRTLLGFARPHTVLATATQVLTIFLIVTAGRTPGAGLLAALALTLVACLALNLYAVNKPYLPLAARTLSLRVGRTIVIGAGLLALGLGALLGPYLLGTIGLIMLIGTLYSLPPLRLKRFPIPAALSIAIARGCLANLGLALHYRSLVGGGLPLATLGLLGLFFFGFGLVIAIYKDMPDAEGDRQHQIETFTTRFGPRRVLGLGRAVLSACYAVVILFAASQLPGGAALFLLVSHALVIALFWAVSARVDLGRSRSIASFYMFLWGMFYTEFVLLSVYELTRAVA